MSIIATIASRVKMSPNRHDPGGKQFVQRLHIGGDPGHQPPNRVAVEEGYRQPLQVAEDLQPEVGHHPLAHPGGEIGLGVIEQERKHQRAQKQERKPAQEPDIPRRHGDVEGPLGQQRSDQGQGRRRQQEQYCQGRQPPVRPEIRQDPAHQLRVVALRVGLGEEIELGHQPSATRGSSSAISTRPLNRECSQRENTMKPKASVKYDRIARQIRV
jgi:hypothetical protein